VAYMINKRCKNYCSKVGQEAQLSLK